MTNPTMSRFRVKKLSPKHPLPVYKDSQLPDIHEATNQQRAALQIETGVEKEEETEHDLQAVLSAAQAAVTTGEKIERYIPTPNASNRIPDQDYQALYKQKHKQPSNLIRFSMTVEEMIGCPYAADEDDVAFLETYNSTREKMLSEDNFEQIMHKFESITKQQMPHLHLDPSQTPTYANMMTMLPSLSSWQGPEADLETIFSHWRSRRLARKGRSIIPELQLEDLVKNDVDPYVCFRRRETKSVRKTRRSDQQSLERLRKLRSEMETARNLLGMVLRREKNRKESIIQEHTIFEKRCQIRQYQRQLGIKDEEALMPVKKKSRTSLDQGSSSTTIKIPLHLLRRNGYDGDEHMEENTPMQRALETELARKRKADAAFEDITENSYQPFPIPLPLHYFQSLSPGESQPRFRKRTGRGGRIFIDRMGFRASQPEHNIDQRYRFDSDYEFEEQVEKVDDMDDSILRCRAQLPINEAELRSLNGWKTGSPVFKLGKNVLPMVRQPLIQTDNITVK